MKKPVSLTVTESQTAYNRKSPTAGITPNDNNRWSEIVPPKSALTFAVVWDADGDIATFTGSELFEFADDVSNTLDSPSDVYDNRSQVLTIRASTVPLSENTATLAFFRENHAFLFSAQTPTVGVTNQGGTRTSSTLGGLDVYARGSLLAKAHTNYRYYSCFDRLDADFKLDPLPSFPGMWLKQFMSPQEAEKYSICDEGFFETAEDSAIYAEDNMCSAFSTTTTSTSNYISVEHDDTDDDLSSWMTLEAPLSPNFDMQIRRELSNSGPQARRLKKRKPRKTPASPAAVLQREDYNHTVERPSHRPSSWSPAGLPKLVRALGKLKRSSSNDQWVCVEATPNIP